MRSQLVHVICHRLASALHKCKQPLEVRGDEDIHRRRRRLIKRAVAVVRAGGQKVRQHVIRVRRAHERSHGKPHVLGVIARQNIAEVSRRDAEIDLVAKRDFAALQQVAVGRDIIHDLRQDSSPVDGVCRREEIALVRQILAQNGIGEDALHAALRVVEVSPYGAHADVLSFLADHLQLLDIRYAAVWVEHKNFCMLHIAEALERGLAGIAGCRDQNADRLVLSGLFEARREQIRKHLKRHVLERARRAVPELHDIPAVSQILHGRGLRVVEFLCAIRLFSKAKQLFLGKFFEIPLHDLRRALRVRQLRERLDFF